MRECFRWQWTVHAIILFELVNQNMESRIQLDKGAVDVKKIIYKFYSQEFTVHFHFDVL